MGEEEQSGDRAAGSGRSCCFNARRERRPGRSSRPNGAGGLLNARAGRHGHEASFTFAAASGLKRPPRFGRDEGSSFHPKNTRPETRSERPPQHLYLGSAVVAPRSRAQAARSRASEGIPPFITMNPKLSTYHRAPGARHQTVISLCR